MRHDPRRAHGDATAGQPIGKVRQEYLQRRKHIAVIGERLTHSHEDDVGHRRLAVIPSWQYAIRKTDLTDDFRRAQIPIEALSTGRTESTIERAADLRRNTQRATARLRDEHGLYGLTRAGFEQPLHRAIGRCRFAQDLRQFYTCDVCKPLAQFA